MLRISLRLAAVLALCVLGGCQSAPSGFVDSADGDFSGTSAPAPAGDDGWQPIAAQTANPNAGAEYRLGSGDKIRLIVYGEPDLGGDFDVDGSGDVRLPLIGEVHAAGLSPRELESNVAGRLSPNFLREARVNVEVTTYRPFFIIGEVNRPGQYPYVNGMNVITAVALAGGYTYRANSANVYVRRGGGAEIERAADERTQIKPGDILRVPERFF